MAEDYESMTVAQLKELLKERASRFREEIRPRGPSASSRQADESLKDGTR